MAAENTVVSNEPPKVPNASFERSLIPRFAAKASEQMRGQVTLALSQLSDFFDRDAKALDRTLRGQNWSAPGREYAVSQAREAFEQATQGHVDQLTRSTRAHMEQLRGELDTVPEPTNWFAAQRIWSRLDGMSESDVDHFLRHTDDPLIVSAVMHAGPFSFGSEAARRMMLTNFAKKHRAAQFTLLQDCEAFVEVLQEFRDGLLRKFRDEIK